jgi:hypothetical protein
MFSTNITLRTKSSVRYAILASVKSWNDMHIFVENGEAVFLQKEKRIVKWVMRFVLFHIPVVCSFFIVRL